IAGGTSATVRVRFAPSAAGAQQDTLKIGTQSVTLRGSGFANGVPNIQAPSPLDLGDVQTGQAKDRVFSISNTGTDNLTINSVSMSGAGFTLANPGTPLTIAPGNSATFTAHVIGGAAGTQSGQLTIASNDPTRGQLQIPVTVRASSSPVPAATSAAVVNSAGYQ